MNDYEDKILNYLFTKCSTCKNRLSCIEEKCFYYQIENVFTNDKQYKDKSQFDDKFINTLSKLHNSSVISFPDAIQLVNSLGYNINQSKIIVNLYSNINPYIKGSELS